MLCRRLVKGDCTVFDSSDVRLAADTVLASYPFVMHRQFSYPFSWKKKCMLDSCKYGNYLQPAGHVLSCRHSSERKCSGSFVDSGLKMSVANWSNGMLQSQVLPCESLPPCN